MPQLRGSFTSKYLLFEYLRFKPYRTIIWRVWKHYSKLRSKEILWNRVVWEFNQRLLSIGWNTSFTREDQTFAWATLFIECFPFIVWGIRDQCPLGVTYNNIRLCVRMCVAVSATKTMGSIFFKFAHRQNFGWVR